MIVSDENGPLRWENDAACLLATTFVFALLLPTANALLVSVFYFSCAHRHLLLFLGTSPCFSRDQVIVSLVRGLHFRIADEIHDPAPRRMSSANSAKSLVLLLTLSTTDIRDFREKAELDAYGGNPTGYFPALIVSVVPLDQRGAAAPLCFYAYKKSSSKTGGTISGRFQNRTSGCSYSTVILISMHQYY